MNLDAKHILEKLEIADRVEYMARKLSYITLNNRKENFSIKPTGGLVNPARSELRKVEQVALQPMDKYFKCHRFLENIMYEVKN